MVHLRWSTTGAAIGAIIAAGAGTIVITVVRNTITKAMVHADRESQNVAWVEKRTPSFGIAR